MTPRIESRSYSYQGYNVVSITATLNIYAVDGVTVIASTGLNASYNLMEPDFEAEVTRQINAQVSEYLAKLQELEARRQALFPDSADFTAAVNLIFDPIQTAIGG
jgi:hypothetical protein